MLTVIHSGVPQKQYTEFLVQIVKDLRRSIDYLETRKDIDSSILTYLGFGWGGVVAPVMLSVEEHLEATVIVSAWLHDVGLAEIHQINFVVRVRIPILMLNDEYDIAISSGMSAKPTFDLLGTQADQKQLRVYNPVHTVPHNELIREMLSSVDQ